MINIKILNTNDVNFEEDFLKLLDQQLSDNVVQTVGDIINNVRQNNDEALLNFVNKFDGLKTQNIKDIVISQQQMQEALNSIRPEQREALEFSIKRVEEYHKKQSFESFLYKDEENCKLGQKVTPIRRVACYVPGGKAAYPSSVVMNIIPAKVAGVKELVVLSPFADGALNNLVLSAAILCGVHEFYAVGGASAIAAAAYGTPTIKPVNKIVGPGNKYVTEAKRQVFGKVGIDMIAGPSEILIICDGKTNPNWIAMDLCSQAEHDEDARAILITTDGFFVQEVYNALNNITKNLPKLETIKTSIMQNSALIQCSNLEEAFELSNAIAPEHLMLAIENAENYLDLVENAGAIFVGKYTPESFGDYVAGPSHVLPTAGAAKFSSPLSVYDFQKRSSIIQCSQQSATSIAQYAAILAYGEGLEAHAKSAEFRMFDSE